MKKTNTLSKEHFDLTIARLANDNHYQQQLELIQLQKEKNFPIGIASYNNILSAICQSNPRDAGSRVTSLLEEMKANNVSLDETTFSIAIPGLAACTGDYAKESFKLLNEMKEAGMKPPTEVFLHVLVALAEKNQIKETEQVVSMVQDSLDSSPSAYNVLIKLYMNLGDKEKLKNVLDQMSSKKIKKDNVTWSLLIDAFKDDSSSMEQLINDMDSSSVPFDRNILSALVSFHVSQGDPAKAETFLKQMIDSNVIPLDFAFSSLMRYYSSVGDVKHLQSVFDTIKKFDAPTREHYHYLGVGYIHQGQFHVWDNIREDMEDNGISPDMDTFHIQLDRVMFDESNSVSAADEVIDEMKEKGFNPTIQTYNRLLDGLSAVGELDATHKVLEDMEAAGINPTPRSYLSVISGYAKAGNLKSATSLIHHFSSLGVNQFLDSQGKKQIESKE